MKKIYILLALLLLTNSIYSIEVSLSNSDLKITEVDTAVYRILDEICLGDLDGDGYDDLIFSTITYSMHLSSHIYIFWGNDSLRGNYSTSNADIIIQDTLHYSRPSTFSGLGSGLSAGDVNSDGYDDLTIGDPRTLGHSHSVISRGYLVMGRSRAEWDSGAVFIHDLYRTKIIGDSLGWNFGTHCLLYDISNDSIPELLFGKDVVDTGICDEGARLSDWSGGIYGFFYNDSLDRLLADIKDKDLFFRGYFTGPSTEREKIGKNFVKGGDINSDGYNDLIIPSAKKKGYPIWGIFEVHSDIEPAEDFLRYPLTYSGRNYIVYGKPNTVWDSIYFEPSPDSNYSIILSKSLCSMIGNFDFNGDNYTDIVACEWGHTYDSSFVRAPYDTSTLYIKWGPSFIDKDSIKNISDKTIFSKHPDDETGRVLTGGDLNGDGIDDLAVSSSTAYNDFAVALVEFGREDWTSVDTINNFTLRLLLTSPWIQNNNDSLGKVVTIDINLEGDINNDGLKDLFVGVRTDLENEPPRFVDIYGVINHYPRVHMESPDLDSIPPDTLRSIDFKLDTRFPVNPSSITVSFNSDIYSIDSTELSYTSLDSTLTFDLPREYILDDTSITICIDSLSDSLGTSLRSPVCWTLPDSFSGIKEGKKLIPQQIKVFPTPFHNSVKIILQPKTNYSIKIYNLTGDIITRLSPQKRTWNPSENIISGVYIIKASAGDKVYSKRVLYLR